MSRTILLEVARKRRALASAAAQDARESQARADMQNAEKTLQAEFADLIALTARFQTQFQELIAKARGDQGPMGPMPRHQWNQERTRVRFQEQMPDGTVGWGPWSADLRGSVAVVGGAGGITEQRVLELITQFASGRDITDLVFNGDGAVIKSADQPDDPTDVSGVIDSGEF